MKYMQPKLTNLLLINFLSILFFITVTISLFSPLNINGQNNKDKPKKEKKKKAKLPPESLASAMLANAQYSFSFSNLKGASISNPTSLQFGPDGRLYVSQQNGIIKVFTVKRSAANDYSVIATETINLINLIPNHNDDGALAPSTVKTRQVTGILVKGTAERPVIYVTSSDSRIGGPTGDLNLDTNSGILSLLSWNGSAWGKIDLIRGFPRSEENHANQGMQLDEQTNTMYIVIGGNTNAGGPSNKFAYTVEYALSTAILSVNLNMINAMPLKGSGNTSYKYDLPTLDDPTRSNNADGSDVGDPFGGNDGLNQAKIVTGGPVQIHSTGYRNAYDIVITKARRMYTIDNGANQGWGGYPDKEGTTSVTNNYVTGEPGAINNLDNLHYIGQLDTYIPGSYYAGHPNPTRANPVGAGLYTHDGTTGVWRTSKTGTFPLPADWPPVPSANPIEGDFQMPGIGDNALLTFNTSTNGIAEYTASNFDNSLKGSLLTCGYNGSVFKLSLTADGTNVTNLKNSTNKQNQDLPFASNFGVQPLDITVQDDSAIFPGTVWVAGYGANAITAFEPNDFVNCTGLYNDLDDDLDGYTNADEIDNATQPCSASSIPPDSDYDFKSDLNDPDDDNDGISDSTDVFALDANNGLQTSLPIQYDLFNNYPGTGLFGLGFTGLMSNNRTDYYETFEDSNLIAGGAVGAFSIVETSAGDAFGALNTQENAFQFGIETAGNQSPFTIHSRMLGPFFEGNTPTGYQSQGVYIGTGNQDNYLKIALNANGGQGGIEVVYESRGVPVTYQFALPVGLPESVLDFFLSVNTTTGKVQLKYAADNGAIIPLGDSVQLTDSLLSVVKGSRALAVGVIATSRGGTPFTATWDFINVTPDPIVISGSWQTITSGGVTPVAREENAYVAAGGKFYLMGGRTIMPVQVYNPKTNSWENKAAPPTELHHFQAVTLNGLIYVAGAFTGSYPHEVPVANIYIYNPVSNIWIKGASIPGARRRGAAGVVAYNNKLYLASGITDGHSSGWVKWFDEYDPATNSWKALPDAPRARDHFNAVIINDNLYLTGGRRSSASTGQTFSLVVPEVDVFNFTTGEWSTLPATANLPIPRAGAGTEVLGNEIVVIGGESTQATAHNETHAFNVDQNTWRRLANLQQGRHGTQAIASNNGIYIVAGSANQGGSPKLSSQEAFYMFTPTAPDSSILRQSQLTAVSNVSFGPVELNTDSSKTVRLSNTGGNQSIVITSINLSDTVNFSYSAPYTLPFVIDPGKSEDVTLMFKPGTQAIQNDSITVNHTGSNNSTVILLKGTVSSNVYRINAGGKEIVNSIGTFAADLYFSPTPGNTDSVSTSINGTADDAIYQTERLGSNGIFNYALPVANGEYQVVLHFAELTQTEANKRVFDVSAEGVKVLDDYDIFQKVANLTATTESFIVNVADSTLNLDFSSLKSDGGVNQPKVSAIEIFRIYTNDNAVPVANAGTSKTIVLPVNSTVLNGSGSDADGTISAYNWTQVSGPSTATFTPGNHDATPTIGGLVAGSYAFSLVVTDNQGANSNASQVTVTVSAANQMPIANAGASKTIVLPVNSTVLNGSGSDADGTINAFKWTQVSGPSTATFTPGNAVASPTVEGLVAGNYVFSLVVMDNQGDTSATSQVTVTVSAANQVPIANAGASKTIVLPVNSTVLNGSASDADGTINTFKWTQMSGPSTATFSPSNAVASPTVEGLVAGSYVFSLVVTDNQGDTSATSQVTVTVSAANQVPIANAGASKTIVLPVNSTVLNGSGSDADGTINAFKWTQVSGPSTATFTPGNAVASPTVGGLVAGTYVFSLVVTDDQNANSQPSQVTVTVNNSDAIDAIVYRINSGGQQTVNSIGTFAADNFYTPTPGYTYSVTTGINGTTNDAMYQTERGSTVNNGTFNYVFPITNGWYKVILHFSENYQTAASKRIFDVSAEGVKVLDNYDIFKKAGRFTATTESFTVYVADGGLNLYFSALASDGGINRPQVTAIEIFRSSLSTNVIPVANAGASKTIVLPVNSTVLNGSGSDPDGTIIAYNWTQVSGPSTTTFTPGNQDATPTIGGLVAGNYVFSLVVTDNQGANSNASQVTVTVNAPANQTPVANAGGSKTIVLPVNSTVLNGSGSDADGTISAFKWAQVSGPSTATFTPGNAVASPTVGGLVAGSYIFSLVVTDNLGANSGASQTNVTVNAATSSTSEVTNFTLVNANDEQDIQILSDGTTLNLATLPTKNLNIRANTSPGIIGNVQFVLSGAQSKTVKETTAPYSLFGDNNGNYNLWTPAVGSYKLTATPYSNTSVAGTMLTINFTVINQTPVTSAQRQISPMEKQLKVLGSPNLKVFPNPNYSGFYRVLFPIGVEGEVSYKIISSLGILVAEGKLVLPKPGALMELNLADRMIASGSYYLHLRGKKLRTVIKLIKGN